MNTFILAFYISISSQPIVPGPDKYGAGMSLILIGASNLETARIWADNYAKTSFLKTNSDQNIAKIVVLPIEQKLLTPEGSKEINWDHLKNDIKNTRFEDHMYDFGSSMGFEFKKINKSDQVKTKPEDPEIIRKALGEKANQMNWNPKKLFYYIANTKERAFLVQSMNLMTSSIPLYQELQAFATDDSLVEVSAFSGYIFRYNTSEQDAAANP